MTKQAEDQAFAKGCSLTAVDLGTLKLHERLLIIMFSSPLHYPLLDLANDSRLATRERYHEFH